MTKTGYVSKIENGRTYVITQCESACGHDCSTCSSSCKSDLRECLAQNTVGAKVGDKVEMSIEDSGLVGLSFLVYMLPLIIIFAGWIVCEHLWNSTLINIITIISLLFLWVVFIVKYNNKGIINKIERIL